MEQIFFDDWKPLLRTAIIGFLAYACLIVLLRTSGKRTLSKMNAFDFVVTVALGSTLATILLSKDVTLAQGILALALLIGMQLVVTWASVRAPWVRAVVTGEPVMLVYRGKFLRPTLHRERVNEADVLAAVRSAGVLTLAQVEAVVLETDGSFSVVKRSDGSGKSSLDGVKWRDRGAPSD